jgi:hypothetical protein
MTPQRKGKRMPDEVGIWLELIVVGAEAAQEKEGFGGAVVGDWDMRQWRVGRWRCVTAEGGQLCCVVDRRSCVSVDSRFWYT